jgi:arsenical pump membrane protein
MPAAILIFLFTLVFVIWQPRGLGIGWSASLGAVLALVFGVVQLADIPVVWQIVWNATATFVAVIVISLLLDEAGFFEWAALHVARWGGGRGTRLFAFIVLLGAAVAALFANDGAALILTPIVMAMLVALGFSPAATLAFVMAAGFIADTASLPLIVSNLVNIVSADFFRLGFTQYAAVMVPVNIAAVLASLLVLLLYFRRSIPASYDMAQLKAPAAAIRDAATFRAGWVVLVLLLVGFFGLEPLGVPVSAVAAVGAVLLLAVAGRGHVISTRRVLRGAPWQIVVFSLGMYLVVYGLRNAGLTDRIATLLDLVRAGRRLGRGAGHGRAHGAAVLGHEQHAHGADRRAVHRRLAGQRRGEGGHGLRQCDRLRPGPQDHAHRQPGHAAVAARVAEEGHDHRLGLLLPRGHRADAARAAGHAGSAGPAPEPGLNPLHCE